MALIDIDGRMGRKILFPVFVKFIRSQFLPAHGSPVEFLMVRAFLDL